ncbi:hypothetical protein IHC87_06800 [Photobacterium damselae subsp. damselae]|uniref:hypothetical protein n=1 Tax=Photobacterium damselae TaxID=38293 RepID=UPI001F33BE18|nr:hypothetical protein [Photobacterium damselae]UJZ95048.1 hypothetical protein IHC87_06800 [Photobacterium damselae subsp. damselae]UJZ99029.1 hypothetical protein IHC88_06790 [Photobacterium damselae subsp. damselae]
MRIKKWSIVTTGVQETGATVTKEMLESAIANFNIDARPPVTLGHPDQNSDQCASYGRVDNPYIIASEKHPGEWELIIDINYTDYLESLEDSGEFEGFSLGLYPMVGRDGWYIHHLAILGGLPPAANIRLIEVVQLSTLPTDKDAIMLSVAVALPESILDMTKDELTQLVTTQVSEAVATAMASQSTAPAGKEPVTEPSAETVKLQEQLSQMQETTKNSIISEVKALGLEKGMTDDEMKPIVDTLQATDAVQLCNVGTNGGIVANMKAIIAAKPDKQQGIQLSNGLYSPLGGITLSNNKPSDGGAFNALGVAEESGF